MMGKKRAIEETIGFLSRLRRDVRGNTLALMAALLIPLAALSGSAVDLARVYAVKTRLQQACDAGALAGRKMMTGSDVLDTSDTGPAQTFFKNNFNQGWFKTNQVNFAVSKTSDGQVSGAATATIPMTVMTMFGMGARTVSVTCEARFDVADADIMFVLDTTGSMACTTSDDPCNAPVQTYTRPDGTTAWYTVEESGSKISGLRSAVMSFYDTLTATADPTTHIRYGFVTYTSTVNVGYLLKSDYLVKNWSYWSRQYTGNETDNGANQTIKTFNNVATSADCTAKLGRQPATGFDSTGKAVNYTSVYSYQSKVCKLRTTTLYPEYKYSLRSLDVSQYITGATVNDPNTHYNTTQSVWQGCIEERDTDPVTTFDINNLPADLDPDLIPNSDGTRWRPMWPEVEYYQTGGSNDLWGGEVTSRSPQAHVGYDVASGVQETAYYSCGKPAQRLKTMTRDDVYNYVYASDFKVIGGTYHDTGMIWGTRLISPSGIFKDDTAAWPERPAPNRFIVFMTDGQMNTNPSIYGLYGVEAMDKRVSGNSPSNDTANHNTRFLAECSAAKARNITVFVVGFGQTLTNTLTNCASPGQAYYAKDNDALTTAFKKIAQQVAMLRISK